MLRIFILSTLPLFSFAQSKLAIGNWASHLPFNAGKQIAEGPSNVYYSTDHGILKVNKSDYSFQRITRTEGLSGSEINAIFYHAASKQLVIAYLNGIIDLYGENGVYTLVDIFNFNNIPIDKVINSIRQLDDENVLICTNYGLSLLNVVSRNFKFTLFTPNLKVFDCIRQGNFYYMATERGAYRFEDNGINIIQNFASWQSLNNTNGLPSASLYHSVVSFDNDIYFSTVSEIFRGDGMQFSSFYKDLNYEIKFVKAGAAHLFAGLNCQLSCKDRLISFDENGGIQYAADGCADDILDVQESSDGKIWYADQRWSFRFSQGIGQSCDAIWVSGPISNRAFEIATLDDAVYVAGGGVDATFTPNYNGEGIAKYKEGVWSAINSGTVPDLAPYNITDVMRIAQSPNKNKIFFASAGKGLIEYDRALDRYKVYNKTNSPLQGTVGDSANVRLSGLAFDRKNTLWITNYLAPAGLVSLSESGEWKNYIFPNNANLFSEIKIDQNGYKWIVSRLSGGVMVFDEGDPANPSDDRRIQLTSSNTEMTSNDVRTVEVDLDGDVWVGTAEGPVVFECGSAIFSGTCKGSRRKVDQDGIIYYLLSSEVITSIAVDGANRKWFGTSNNGIYVQSPTGEFQIYNFNTSNSPLLDNNIIDIAVDPKTGEAWIATASGVQVFRSDATLAKDVFTGSARVFPNPVGSDYDGPIAISGLARDARIKITDLSGRLVYESFSNGGEAIWNGRDYLGRKVVSGVYLVFANTTQDFETAEGLVTKIVITR